jgi:hypothetical protein
MKRMLSTIILVLALTSAVYAAQSSITDAEGSACMGDDRSRKQTEDAALADAKKKAVEYASTYLKSETNVKNFVVEKDLVFAYAHATVRIVQELEKSWYKDPATGDCCRIKVKAEVIPDEKAMTGLAKNAAAYDDPSAPLSIRLWTDKKEYKSGEKIKVFIKGNKPFYARILYKDAGNELIQLLPNPYRSDNYFNGGVIYELPSGNDKYELEVSPPFGEENVIIYAGTSPLGEIKTEARGGFYQVKTQPNDIGMQTRGVRITPKSGVGSVGVSASEFYEDKAVLKTGRKE